MPESPPQHRLGGLQAPVVEQAFDLVEFLVGAHERAIARVSAVATGAIKLTRIQRGELPPGLRKLWFQPHGLFKRLARLAKQILDRQRAAVFELDHGGVRMGARQRAEDFSGGLPVAAAAAGGAEQ